MSKVICSIKDVKANLCQSVFLAYTEDSALRDFVQAVQGTKFVYDHRADFVLLRLGMFDDSGRITSFEDVPPVLMFGDQVPDIKED